MRNLISIFGIFSIITFGSCTKNSGLYGDVDVIVSNTDGSTGGTIDGSTSTFVIISTGATKVYDDYGYFMGYNVAVTEVKGFPYYVHGNTTYIAGITDTLGSYMAYFPNDNDGSSMEANIGSFLTYTNTIYGTMSLLNSDLSYDGKPLLISVKDPYH